MDNLPPHMKIGILTLHAQLNYGGILQAFALQRTLERLGYETVVIDRWLSPDNAELHPYEPASGIRRTTHRVLDRCFGLGQFARIRRSKRTVAFLRNRLKLTPYHFHEWSEAPTDLDVDLLVVGSDQVWKDRIARTYLLDGAPNIPAIAYGASFGMHDIPGELIPLYRSGIRRFRAVSVREHEGCHIAKMLGVSATKVVDPVFLLSRDDWLSVDSSRSPDQTGKLVCYFMAEPVIPNLGKIFDFSCRNGTPVDIFSNGVRLRDGSPFSTSYGLARLPKSLVRVREDAGPAEFLTAISNAQSIITDSFHALAFALLLGKNVRVLAPRSLDRRAMFSRIEELASRYSDGALVVPELETGLLELERQHIRIRMDVLEQDRIESRDWLNRTLLAASR